MWLEHRLWGRDVLGFHLANIFQHALSAFLLFLLLRKLGIRGAWLAAAAFAVHPVNVESVAWMTQQKNTLSGVFFFGALLCHLAFDETRRPRWYLASVIVFAAALLAKTSTTPFPVVVLVMLWWRRGSLELRRDILPLVPFFGMSLVAGLVTAWMEKKHCGAEGIFFNLSLVERGLIAGRASLFYLGKLLWPVDLVFSYPRWNVDGRDPSQYLYPLGLSLLLGAAWRFRARSRAPLAALLVYLALLFPALGFFNVYAFVFSFVADHWHYLASAGMLSLFLGVFISGIERVLPGRHRIHLAAGLLLVAVLAGLTWRQSRIYKDAETVYRDTLARNPESWMAWNNLGLILKDSGRREEALANFRRVLELRPCSSPALNNIGRVLADYGRHEEALRTDPSDGDIHNNLGISLAALGRIPEAIKAYETALRLKPNFAAAETNYGLALLSVGRTSEAIERSLRAVAMDPEDGENHYNLGSAYLAAGRIEEAMSQLREALSLGAVSADAYNNMGVALMKSGRPSEAAAQFQEALRLDSGHFNARRNLGVAMESMKSGGLPATSGSSGSR